MPVHDDAAAAQTATIVSNKALVVRTASIASAIMMRVRGARRIAFGEFACFEPVDMVIDGDTNGDAAVFASDFGCHCSTKGT